MYYLLLFLFFSLSSYIYSQSPEHHLCGHQIEHPTKDEADMAPCASPGIKTKWMTNYHKNPLLHKQKDNLSSTTYLPISLHIVGNDDSTGYAYLSSVLNAFCRVNQEYKSTGIQFFIEFPIHYIQNSAFNSHDSVIIGGGFMLQYNVPNTTNCYIVTNPSGACGYNVLYGGLTVSKNCLSANTFSHELGHALGLQHTFFGWEGGQSYNGNSQQTFTNPSPNHVLYDYTVYKDTMWPADTIIVDTTEVEYVARTGPNSNCHVAADGFCDTPSDYLAFRWNCNSSNQSNVQQIDPDTVSFYSEGINIMSYSTCRTQFSTEQGQYMNAFVQANRQDHLYNQNPIVDSISIANLTMLEPIANTVLNSTTGVTFRWNAVPGATHYSLKVCEFSCGSSNSLVEEVLLTDTFYVSPLNYPPRLSFFPYRWQVMPFNQSYSCAGQSPTQNFNTQNPTLLTTINPISNIICYPNPIEKNQNLIIEAYSIKQIFATVNLSTITGKRINNLSWELNKGNNQFEISTEYLSHGIYILNIEAENNRIYKKIIINK